ncbi:phage tail tape measure protein [Enterococcus faecalis]|uniref:phage tail tape measure protein n=1 Tax=Enterococcus faecalis TaxID=1351 RepID=UPI00202361B0|nr:phage tail tape measure protein [Enterococcus faecalis]MCL8363546.1 phage tail tape measure protein [Enterococcus faecalis]HAP2790711.1 transglycosylase SLT domain-containing protein [Enterococcus faecalis]HAP3443018.1 transglycosylase SLT domain-containing protein [Enterococcus faecalis]HAP5386364.1 transglycosylase SLT domain-containing protein [Enterococcus faecalis]HAP5387852.1 transglycosylase SLT domain-containing protein [Enterococcus faecalis]
MAKKGKPIGSIGGVLTLDGTQFGNTLDEITRGIKLAESAMKTNMKILGDAGKSYDGLSQHAKDLEVVMEGQRKKVEELTKRHKESSEKYGENSKQAQNLAVQVNKATEKYTLYERQLNNTKKEMAYASTEINKLSQEMKDNEKETNSQVTALKRAGDEAGAMEVNQKGLARQVSLSKQAVEEQRKVVERLSKEFGENSTETLDAKNALAKLERQADSSQREFKALGNSVEDAGSSSKKLDMSESMTPTEKGLGALTEGLGGFKGMLKGGFYLAGIQAVKNEIVDIVKGISDASQSFRDFKAQLGLADKATGDLVNTASTIYSEGFGESLDEVQESLVTVKQLLPNLDNGSLKQMATDALAFSKATGSDLNESLRGAVNMVKNFKISGTEAFDYLNKGAQTGLNISDELADNMTEYSQVLYQMGFTAKDTMGVLNNGLQNGAFNLDKVNDFVKEFGISLNDGRIEENLGSFSQGTQELFVQYRNGEATAKDVMMSLISDLENMKNKQDEATLASNIWSALGEDNALQVVESLNDVNHQYDNVDNSAKNVADNVKDISPWEILKRNTTTAFTDIGVAIAPLGNKLGENILQGAQSLKAKLKPTMDGIKGIIYEFAGNDDQKKQGHDILAKLMPEASIKKVESAINQVKKAMDIVKNAISATFISLTPIFDSIIKTLFPMLMPIFKKIGDAISSIFSEIKRFWDENGKQFIEAFKNFLVFIQPVLKIVVDVISSFVDSVVGFIHGILGVIQGAIKVFTGLFTGDFKKMWEGIKQIFFGAIEAIWNWINISFIGRITKGIGGFGTSVKTIIKNMWTAVKGFFTGGIGSAIGSTANFVKSIGSRIGSMATSAKNIVKGMWTGIKNFFVSGINSAVGSTVNFIKNIGSHLGSMGMNAKNIVSSMWSGIKNFFSNGISGIVNKVKALPKMMGDGIRNGGDALKNALVGMWEGAVKGISAPVNMVIGGANWILDKFGSKNKIQEWHPYAKGTDGHKGGHAIVNDGAGAELIQMPDGRMFLPQGKNVLIPNAPRGMKVLPAEQTAKIMGRSTPTFAYKNGIGDFFGGMWDGVKQTASNVKDFALDIFDYAKNPAKLVSTVVDKFVNFNGLSGVFLDMGKGLVDTAKNSMFGWVKNLFAEDEKKNSAPAGTGVERWRGTVKKALGMVGLPVNDAYTNAWLSQIQTESGGNEKAVQGGYTDINTITGDLAKGLVQVIGATFEAFKMPGHNDRMNGLDNLLAGMRYAMSRYGKEGMLQVIGHGHGYENGGIISMPQFASIAENGAEAIIPLAQAKRSRAVQLLNKTANYLGVGTTGSNASVEAKLDKLIQLMAMLVTKSEPITVNQYLEQAPQMTERELQQEAKRQLIDLVRGFKPA